VSDVKSRFPDTATGVTLFAVEPLASPLPQQSAAPLPVNPQVCLAPAPIVDSDIPATGSGVQGESPLPSWPAPFPPQQYTVPEVERPQV
jgi:hypothetical protein